MAETATKLSWDEIKRTFPNEWVVLLDYELDGDIPVNGVMGGLCVVDLEDPDPA